MNEEPGSARGTDQKFCFSCAALLHVSALACPHCGAQQPPLPGPAGAEIVLLRNENPPVPRANQIFCRGCGQLINHLALACPHCGAPQVPAAGRAPLPPVGRNRYAAAAFAFFLGGFGIHKFYLGEVGLGIIYLLFCWTFIPAIIGFIECIVYLATPDETFARRYG